MYRLDASHWKPVFGYGGLMAVMILMIKCKLDWTMT